MVNTMPLVISNVIIESKPMSLTEAGLSMEDKVTRFEVIDDTGRAYVRYGVKVSLSFQDEGRTLKVFIEDRGEEA